VPTSIESLHEVIELVDDEEKPVSIETVRAGIVIVRAWIDGHGQFALPDGRRATLPMDTLQKMLASLIEDEEILARTASDENEKQ
jgi:hypothetical protein